MTTPGVDAAPSTRFFRYFQHEVTELQEQMERLRDLSVTGGERSDGVDHCLAGIARLSKEVQDASSYVPAYDQRTYSAAIKALSEKLQKTRAEFNPRPRFTFKSTLRSPITASRSFEEALDAAQQQQQDGSSSPTSNRDSHAYDGDELSSQPVDEIQRPSFSSAKAVTIRNHSAQHIIVPSHGSRAASSAFVSNIKTSIIDLSLAPAFSSLALRNVQHSLLLAGRVNGALHVTGMRNSVLVATTRQLRLHDCVACDIYLHCGSRPIIEGCRGLRFAPLPGCLTRPSGEQEENRWDRIDDFNWLKPDQSPNWEILLPAERLEESVWTDDVQDAEDGDLEDLLKNVGVVKA